jgi:drug/metabolite transporter (DMT)-like permease
MPFIWIGVTLFAGSAAQQIGLVVTSVSNSGFLTSLYIIMVPLLSVLVFRQFPHWIVWPAAMAALGGVYLLSGGWAGSLNAGDWFTVLSAVFWAIQIVLIAKYAVESERPLAMAFIQFALTGFLGIVTALFAEKIDVAGIPAAVPLILYAGLLEGALAFTLQIVAQRYTTSSNAAIMLASEAPFAALFGALILGERLSPIALGGGALIVAAMLAVEIVPQLGRRTLAPAAQQ